MRKKTRRRNWALINPVYYAISGAATISQELLDQQRVAELKAMQAFRDGHATRGDWDQLRLMLLMAFTMAKNGVGPEALPSCRTAWTELLAAKRRSDEGAHLGLTGQGITAMREAYEYHDLQRQSVSYRRLQEFFRWVSAVDLSTPASEREGLTPVKVKDGAPD